MQKLNGLKWSENVQRRDALVLKKDTKGKGNGMHTGKKLSIE